MIDSHLETECLHCTRIYIDCCVVIRKAPFAKASCSATRSSCLRVCLALSSQRHSIVGWLWCAFFMTLNTAKNLLRLSHLNSNMNMDESIKLNGPPLKQGKRLESGTESGVFAGQLAPTHAVTSRRIAYDHVKAVLIISRLIVGSIWTAIVSGEDTGPEGKTAPEEVDQKVKSDSTDDEASQQSTKPKPDKTDEAGNSSLDLFRIDSGLLPFPEKLMALLDGDQVTGRGTNHPLFTCNEN